MMTQEQRKQLEDRLSHHNPDNVKAFLDSQATRDQSWDKIDLSNAITFYMIEMDFLSFLIVETKKV